ncbi:CRTAC1 family protein [Maribacter sp. 1_MG-2023]|uniref:CRTAC1 family protein n=1 Tax=Maribacter sp. 1_MG-2023 TaxID=3062677 RepID=UPI0026E47E22|nr:CRTAC1 family protein [Maribacter sp. 1_MG-2023]MDO6473353.1 CRTAC1 family protein [Maribacter sp. 1_MG-2023]
MKSDHMQYKTKVFVIINIIFLGFVLNAWSQEKSSLASLFTETFEDFPRKEVNLRKWDAPVVADLDKDGYPDLILNDHGLGISVCWNNKGKFAKPYDVIMGDLHGVAIGDFDFDGVNEMVLSRGGGSGSNARNSKMYKITKKREFIPMPDFNVPLEMMRGRTLKFFDGDMDGDLDLLNFAFPSKEKKGQSENYIYENDTQGQLLLKATLPMIKADGQKSTLTDFNDDGIVDILLYGNGKVKIYQGNGDLTFVEKTNVLPFDIEEVTAISEIDFDNDGDFDLIMTRGKEFEIGETFLNKETQTWGFFTKRGDFQFQDLFVGDVLNMNNFQSQWPFNDAYYIGESAYKYEFSGETHSGKDIRLVNSNALGFPDVLNPEGGIHVGYVGNDKWRIAGSTFAPTTGAIIGVKEYPDYKHPKGLSDVLLENKNGKFVDVTKKANLLLEDHTVGVSVADFDNNGSEDILVIRRGELVFENNVVIYLNQGDATFKQLNYNGISTSDIGSMGMAVEVLDYDLDGDVDVVIGNERGKWHLFENSEISKSKKKFITVEVGNAPSGKATALGALVSLTNCKNKQLKRVGATGSAYSSSFNSFIHFGVGTCTRPLKVNVTWTNGESVSENLQMNTKVFIGKK